MAWIKSVSVDGDGTSAFSSSTFTPSEFMMILNNRQATTALNDYFRVGNNTISASGYAWRSSQNGTTPDDDTSSNTSGRTEGLINQSGTTDAGEIGFSIIYALNIATEEKLFIHRIIDQISTGASQAPNRREASNKWVETTNQINIVGSYSASGTYNANSNIAVLGSDGTEELNVQDGAIYYDTDLNKEYVLYNNTWTEV
jgi:hypothetical protein